MASMGVSTFTSTSRRRADTWAEPISSRGDLLLRLCGGRGGGGGYARLQLLQDLPGPAEHRLGHSGQLGHLDAVALVGAAPDDLAQEEDVVLLLLAAML